MFEGENVCVCVWYWGEALWLMSESPCRGAAGEGETGAVL